MVYKVTSQMVKFNFFCIEQIWIILGVGAINYSLYKEAEMGNSKTETNLFMEFIIK